MLSASPCHLALGVVQEFDSAMEVEAESGPPMETALEDEETQSQDEGPTRKGGLSADMELEDAGEEDEGLAGMEGDQGIEESGGEEEEEPPAKPLTTRTVISRARDVSGP